MAKENVNCLEGGVDRCPPTHTMRSLGPEYPEQFKPKREDVIILTDPENYFDGVLPLDELAVRLNDEGRVMRE